jgi:creatinine amidohydrolase
VDVLHFAHGPLQSHVGRPTSLLYLAGPDAEWIGRFRSTLDVEYHDLRVLTATLRAPFSVLEFEAMFDDLVLRFLSETQLDLVDWPGRDAEEALYSAGPQIPLPAIARRDARRKRLGGRVLDERVWPEVEADLASGRDAALIGLGSIEQHGPHLPLGTDHWIAEALARGLAARLDDAIALPALSVGCAREHLDFAGTLSVEPDTLERVLGDLLDSLVKHRFERAFIWTAHGGNVDALEAMRERLTKRAGALRLVLHTDIRRVAEMQAAAVRAEGIDPEHAGPHAGEYETSLVAALRPGSVRRASLGRGRVVSAEEAQGLFYPSLRSNAPGGVLGDPSLADADRGLRYLDAWLDLLEDAYRAAFDGRTEKKRQ